LCGGDAGSAKRRLNHHKDGRVRGWPGPARGPNISDQSGAVLLVHNGTRDSARATDKTADRSFLDHLLLVNWFRIHLLQVERSIPDLAGLESTRETFDSRGSVSLLERRGRQDNFADFIPDGVFAITRKRREPENPPVLSGGRYGHRDDCQYGPQ
jgi:hypothetical protein